ncbi:hypothetical protein L1987_64174 [Smallanthus sonchifolius]|uniref:Uncharacterized protein n=1 Tax=Smallanthus sonchifolius TaxID=185202 RepID=A0ACB9CF71_9ASTR|nr:hypothetical protein L1987_64174 [Smallanthus sonchifolius]
MAYRSTSASSFASSNAAAEDLRELIRASSTARMRDVDVTRADVEVYVKKHVGSQRVGRSVSVGMGRIDEDAPVSSFPDDGDQLGRKGKSTTRSLMFPRSRSHVVTSNKFNRFS